MKVIVAGSTGMVGSLVLQNCLNSNEINEVISLVRKKTTSKHKKLTEIVIKDFEDYSGQTAAFKKTQTAYFCIGAYSGKVNDAMFKKITVDYAVKFAEALKRSSPKSTICLLSGSGSDQTEKSRVAFARYKGMAENQINNLNMKFYTFRPGYIYPVEPREEPNVFYKILRVIYPIIKIFGKRYSIKSTELAKAMFNVGLKGAEKSILENEDMFKYLI